MPKSVYKLLSWNVNGIRAVATKGALKWIGDAAPDYLGLQEIKATEEQIPNDLFDREFSATLINSGSRKGYSGTMVCTSLPVESHHFRTSIDTLDEGRIIETAVGDLVILNVYFPNGQKDEERLAIKMKFYDDFLDHCQQLRRGGKSIVICGDVNTAHRAIDLKNPKANASTSGFLPEERAWIDKLLEHGYIDTFRYVHGDVADAYSWWSYRFNARLKNVGWRIDYFFVSEDLKDRIADAYILPEIGGSDHCPVGLELHK